MGLIHRLRRKASIYGWRARYWWLDTPSGAAAQVVAFCIAVFVAVIQLIRIATAAVVPPPAGEPVKAVYWWVVQLIMLVVSAAISYAMRPKVEQAKPASSEAPSVEDGQSVKHHFGTCWVDDSFILAWLPLGTKPIKSKGGKGKWTPGILPGTTNPIEAWLDDKWNVSGLGDVDDPFGGGWDDGDSDHSDDSVEGDL